MSDASGVYNSIVKRIAAEGKQATARGTFSFLLRQVNNQREETEFRLTTLLEIQQGKDL